MMQTEFRSRSRSVIDVKRRILHKRQNLDERVVSLLNFTYEQWRREVSVILSLSLSLSLSLENDCLQKDNGGSHLPCIR